MALLSRDSRDDENHRPRASCQWDLVERHFLHTTPQPLSVLFTVNSPRLAWK